MDLFSQQLRRLRTDTNVSDSEPSSTTEYSIERIECGPATFWLRTGEQDDFSSLVEIDLEPGMGIEPTSAIVGFYTAGCGSVFCSPPPEPFGLR